MPELRVLFFARSRELAGSSQGSLSFPEGATSAQLARLLLEQYPALEEMRGTFALSLNQEYVDPSEPAPLGAGDEVAVIPPISGG